MKATETKTTVTNELKTEGSELAAIAKKRSTRDRREFRRDIEDDGFGKRLGQLMLDLEAITEGERISSATLKDVGVNTITSALRSEWKWFVVNETEARNFIKASKKGFTNVSALKTAMSKAAKAEAKAKASTEGDSESEATEGEASEKAATEGETLDVSTIAVAIHALASRDGKSVEDVISEIIDIFDETTPAAIAA